MRDLLKFLIVGIVLLFGRQAYAGSYNVLVLPDNIVTENATVDSFIYNAASEFFANEIVTLLNETDNITALPISEVRNLYKNDPSAYMVAKQLTTGFKTSYNADTMLMKKLANKACCRYVLMLTSYIDYENYILRRTFWDFLNVPGATVIDPAYKVSTYALLFDAKKNTKLWSDTYYKTISICENRIITRGPSPQTEQLEKIRDYSRSLCPQIAQSVQIKILPSESYMSETVKITDDMGNLDNVFTKKYRKYIKSCTKKMAKKESNASDKTVTEEKTNFLQKENEPNAKLEVKAQPVKDTEINNKKPSNEIKQAEQPINYYKELNFDIKKSKTNSLLNNTKTNRPLLRDYSL